MKFRYQVREDVAGFSYFCSQMCQQKDVSEPSRKSHSDVAPVASASTTPRTDVHVPRPQSVSSVSAPRSAGPCACDVCGRSFAFEFPFQVSAGDRGTNYYCSMSCRSAAKAGVLGVTRAGARTGQGPRRIAVFNHKGGTGKTTTAVNLAAGLAEAGNRVLLVDADGQGNVGASLGIRGEHTLYHVLVQGISVERAAVPVRDKLDVLTSNELLAAAELHLATRPNRDRIMRERLGERVSGYDVVVIDCAPALSLMNQNALVYADSVLIPVSCDYLSLVGVKQVLRTLKSVREMLKHDVSILGVLPTFYDARANISRDAIAALKEHFGERCLPPIRVSTKLREAPSVKKTIFEHAPDSTAAEDYARVVEHIRRIRGDASLLDRATTSEVGLRVPSESTHAQQELPDLAALAG